MRVNRSSGGAALVCLVLLAGVDASSAGERLDTVDRTNARAPAREFDRLGDAAAERGHVRAIVGLRTRFTPEGMLSGPALRSQRDAIATARRTLVLALTGTDFEVTRIYQTIPFVALRLSPAAVRALERSGQAATLTLSTIRPAALAQSTEIVEATTAARANRTGRGQSIAILDTGVDATHPFLQQADGSRKVRREACFSVEGDCRNGQTSHVGPGAGAPCAAPDCVHGTHVAGIAAGRGSDFSGVARDASLISVRVFAVGPCAHDPAQLCSGYSLEDAVKGLEYVYSLRTELNIAAANMSLGGGALHAEDCDAEQPETKAIIDNLLSVGIASVAASGNNGSKLGVINSPACVSTAVTVGATDGAEEVADFSNSAPLVDLLAPGVDINSSVTGGGFEVGSGTSTASPHVAGAWAIMRQVAPSASVATVLQHLQARGTPITDPANNVTRPLIQIFGASSLLEPVIVMQGERLLEGDMGRREAAFTISLSDPINQVVTMTAATQSGFAIPPEDYLHVSEALTFAPGETRKLVTVPVRGDHKREANESFFMTVSGTNLDVLDGREEAVILNDDSLLESNCFANLGLHACGVLGPPLP